MSSFTLSSIPTFFFYFFNFFFLFPLSSAHFYFISSSFHLFPESSSSSSFSSSSSSLSFLSPSFTSPHCLRSSLRYRFSSTSSACLHPSLLPYLHQNFMTPEIACNIIASLPAQRPWTNIHFLGQFTLISPLPAIPSHFPLHPSLSPFIVSLFLSSLVPLSSSSFLCRQPVHHYHHHHHHYHHHYHYHYHYHHRRHHVRLRDTMGFLKKGKCYS